MTAAPPVFDASAAESSSSWLDTIEALDPKTFLEGFLSQQVRPDERTFSMVRPTTVVRGVLQKNTHGSALVRLGDTQVLAGVTLLVATGPLGGESSVVSVTLSNGNGSSCQWMSDILHNAINVDEFAAISPKASWRLRVACQVLNDAGNVEDTALLAAVVALQECRIPATQITLEGVVEIVETEDDGKKLDLNHIPVPLTVGLYHQKNDDSMVLLADPAKQETPILQGIIRLVVSSSANQELLHISHSSQLPISRTELAVAAQMTFGRTKELLGTVLKSD